MLAKLGELWLTSDKRLTAKGGFWPHGNYQHAYTRESTKLCHVRTRLLCSSKVYTNSAVL